MCAFVGLGGGEASLRRLAGERERLLLRERDRLLPPPRDEERRRLSLERERLRLLPPPAPFFLSCFLSSLSSTSGWSSLGFSAAAAAGAAPGSSAFFFSSPGGAGSSSPGGGGSDPAVFADSAATAVAGGLDEDALSLSEVLFLVPERAINLAVKSSPDPSPLALPDSSFLLRLSLPLEESLLG